jgi:tRNA 2-thiocytidine biosynthesis protein TtcA
LQRSQSKQMLQDWERQWPGRTESLFRSLQHIAPSQLADRALFDFVGLEAARHQGQTTPTEPPDWALEDLFTPSIDQVSGGLTAPGV